MKGQVGRKGSSQDPSHVDFVGEEAIAEEEDGAGGLEAGSPGLTPMLSRTNKVTKPEESITSPFPFLEVACEMIESLASAG